MYTTRRSNKSLAPMNKFLNVKNIEPQSYANSDSKINENLESDPDYALLLNEVTQSKELITMLSQELNQLKTLNHQLMDKVNRYEEHEMTILDKHMDYEHIQEGFDKICQQFSDVTDPSLGNLSVRGATK